MIRIERVHLPSGLRALAHRDPNGDLVIYVAIDLDARRQRAAIMEAVRASRRAGWRVVLPGALVALATARLLMRSVVHSVRSQLAAWSAVAAAVAGVAAIAALVLVTGRPPHGQTAGARPEPGGITMPVVGGSTPAGGSRSAPGSPGGHAPPGLSGPAPGQPGNGTSGPPAPPSGGPSSAPTPEPSSPGSPPTPPPGSPTPAPTPTATPTQPSSPSPSPTASPPKNGQPGSCVIVLGIKVCVPLSLSVELHL